LDLLNFTFLLGTLGLALVLVPMEFRHSLQHWSEWLVLAVMFFAVGTGVTAGYHRLFSHRAYRTGPVVRFLLLCFGAASFENSVLHWASDHRVHHSQVDSPGDPYNIGYGFWYAHWLWVMERRVDPIVGVADLEKDPLVCWQHRHIFLIGAVVSLLPPLVVGLASHNLIGHLIIGVLLRIVLTHHTTFLINSAAHVFGSRPYTDANTARDNAFLAPMTFGEGYHNFHHMWQWDYRNGVRWYQWDTTKWLILALNALGLVKDLRRVPEPVIRRARLLMEEKALLARLAKAAPQTVAGLDIQVVSARERLVQAVAALYEHRDSWQARKAERRACRRSIWAERKADWQATLDQRRIELRGAWSQWRAARTAVHRLRYA
jgi:stearoyl-CoA desaturase (delta-9 desaturase)